VQPGSRQGPILLVEDDVDLCALIGVVLEHEGFRVVRASGALEALKMIADETPLAIITDVNMPGGSGVGLLGSMRADTRTAGVPVVVMSGTDQQEDVNWIVKQLGNASFVRKPFSLEELVRCLLRALPTQL
jgi:DNA-binding response OmpR family regulator